MKTTVNLGAGKRIVVSPLKTGGVLIEVQAQDPYEYIWETRLPLVISEDAAGALIFGLEQAFDAIAHAARASLQQAAAAA